MEKGCHWQNTAQQEECQEMKNPNLSPPALVSWWLNSIRNQYRILLIRYIEATLLGCQTGYRRMERRFSEKLETIPHIPLSSSQFFTSWVFLYLSVMKSFLISSPSELFFLLFAPSFSSVTFMEQSPTFIKNALKLECNLKKEYIFLISLPL